MFITFKLTLRRLFCITAAIIIVVLCADGIRRIIAPEPPRYSTHVARAKYLKKQGIEIETTPLYTKQTVADKDGLAGWAEYAAAMKKKGFDLTPFFGKSITVVCYPIKGGANKGVRMLLCKDYIAAYEVVDTF